MYGYSKKLDTSFEQAVKRVKEELAKVKFGVVSETVMHEVFKEKFDINFRKFILLGVCNPSYAHKILTIESEAGLMLPCKIIIYEQNNDIIASTILPTKIMDKYNNQELNSVAEQVEAKLKKAIDNI